MKRLILPLLLLCLVSLTGCGSQWSEQDSIQALYDVMIAEKLFIAQANEIYLNAKDYLGKTIALEGMFFCEAYEPAGAEICVVVRYGPGCCGNDSNVGFEVCWEDESIVKPENNAWVIAVGKLEQYVENGLKYLRLNLSEMTTMTTRGKETVTQ